MTDQWNNSSGVQDHPTPHEDSNSRWIRRPRRSTGDRKIAGVAGGLGRAFGIDPVLIRVAFVVLTVFGGFGGLLYVLGWLLLPADGDEVSAAEALLGRGRSSVPPSLAVGLGVVAVVAAFSMFSWGLPFLPLAIGGVIVLSIMHKRGRLGHREWKQPHHWHGDWSTPGDDRRQDWMTRTDEQVTRITEQAQQWAERARYAGEQARNAGRSARCGSTAWGSHSRGGDGGGGQPGAPAGGSSPFEQPAFWDRPESAIRVDRPAPRNADGVDLTKTTSPSNAGPSNAGPSDELPADPAPRTTPPAWDPLGVAPFAWDLPEPTPLASPVVSGDRGGQVIARATMGATLLVGGLVAAGVFAGWWTLAWSQVAGIALGVLGLGLLFSALRGRGYSLIGPGVFLSLVTLALAVTGISGTSGYGQTEIKPANYSAVLGEYTSNAGDLTLDLSSVTIPSGQVKNVNVELKGGYAKVVIPASMKVDATCDAQLGRADCLGQIADGIGRQSTASTTGTSGSGTLKLTVKVNAGYAEVKTVA
ncbi:phage shock protein PspC (stress-responsive transcriptional regulator) [Nakamurella sp. UYEF19]|uniref:PspC domain-containing protein n=1 Tax=Nakamurella sp. UYEF19 TaxID=1756392 RepID=UPI003397A9E5